jgi:hypothetical protein
LLLRDEALAWFLTNLAAHDFQRHRPLDPVPHPDTVAALGCSVRTARLLKRWRTGNRNVMHAMMACASRKPTRSIPNPAAVALDLAQMRSAAIFETAAQLQCLRQTRAPLPIQALGHRTHSSPHSALGVSA